MPLILLGREHLQDAEDRNAVGKHGYDHARSTVTGTSLLRIDHLLRGPVLKLEADVVEQKQRHQAEEHAALLPGFELVGHE